MTLTELALKYKIKDPALLKLYLNQNGLRIYSHDILKGDILSRAVDIINKVMVPAGDAILIGELSDPLEAQHESKNPFSHLVHFEKNQFQKFLDGPLSSLVEKYNLDEIREKQARWNLKLPSSIENLILYLESKTKSTPKDRFMFTQPTVKVRKAVQFQKYQFESDWKKNIGVLWLSAEMAFNEYCQEQGWKVNDLNITDTYGEYDFKINDMLVDVKSRCNIGPKMDSSLEKKNFKPNETIAFFISSTPQYDRDVRSDFVGLYKKGIFNQINLKYAKPDDERFLNPMSFVSPYHFFQTKTPLRPLFVPELLRLLTKDQIHYQKLLHFYDPISVLKTIAKGEYQKLIQKLISLYETQSEHLAPILIFEHLLEEIKTGHKLNRKNFEEKILPLFKLNNVQHRFINSYLNVLDILADSDNKCKFTGTPFNQCIIDVSSDGLSVFAKAPGSHRSNTLLSYSWYGGEVLSYGEENVRVCDDQSCGCLVKETRNHSIGRKGCYYYGEKGVKFYKDRKAA